MFKANSQTQFVPSKTISIKPEAQVDYNPSTQNQIRFLIPQYVGYYDPKSTTMKFNFVMSGRGHPKPDARAGIHSLYRDLRVRDGMASAELEAVQDTNVLTATWWDYTANESINHKRDLFEGRSKNTNLGEQLYYGAPGDWSAGDVTTTHSRKTLEINHPILNSDLLGGKKIVPVIALKGLRFELTLDKVGRSIVHNSNRGCDTGTNFCESKIQLAIGTQAKSTEAEEHLVDIKSTGVVSGVSVNRDASPKNNNPFDIGDRIYISDNSDGANEESLGVVTAFKKDGDGDLRVVYIPDRANASGLTVTHPIGSRVFFKSSDRLIGVVVSNVPAAQVTAAAEKTSYTISNLELLLQQMQPPMQYVKAMQSSITSSKGMTLQLKNYQLYRFNLSTQNGITNQLIPATQRQALSIMSVPLAVNQQGVLQDSAFKGQTDGVQSSQYVYGSTLIPDRPLELARYNQSPARTEALHLNQVEDALINAGYSVRNLLRVPDRFLLARGFSKYNQVFNLSDDTLSLRVEYEGATKEKLFNHYIVYYKNVNISSQGIQVSA